MDTEADTCRKYSPLRSIAEQRTFTDGCIVPVGDKIHRLQQKRADYLLRYRLRAPLLLARRAQRVRKRQAPGRGGQRTRSRQRKP